MKNRLKELLQKHKEKCDYLEIRFEEFDTLSISISSRELAGVNRNFEKGAAIRAAYKGGWGFASSNEMSTLEQAVQAAIEQARHIGNQKTMLAEMEPLEAEFPLELKEDPRQVSLGDKINMLQEYSHFVLDFNPLLKHCMTSYQETVSHKILATSQGTLLDRVILDLSCAVRPTAIKNGLSQQTYVTDGSSNDFSVVRRLKEQLEFACDTAIELVHAPAVKGGKYPVVLDPHLGGTFAHEAFGHFSEADDYMENPQMIATFPLGKKVGSELISIYDTGLDEGTRGYTPFDDEGVPGQKTMLLDHGTLVGRLHSRESAARFNEKPTGSARAKDYRFPPICRMRNTCIANGESSFEELLEGIDEGVYAIKTIGGHGGEMFSFNALYGYMIRKGKVAEMVRDVSISGNLFTTLLNIDAVGNDFTIEDSTGGCGKGAQFPLPVTSSSPHFRIKEATVGGTS